MIHRLLVVGPLLLSALAVAHAADETVLGRSLVVKNPSTAARRTFLTTWVGAGHVPYLQRRTEILDQTTNFLWWEMDLANAAH